MGFWPVPFQKKHTFILEANEASALAPSKSTNGQVLVS